MTASGPGPQMRGESSMYELFIGLMTVVALLVMFLTVVVQVRQVDEILRSVDSLFCVLFFADFVRCLKRAPDRRAYVFGERPGRSLPSGVLDLIGCIPVFGIFRLFRLFRLARISRIVQVRGGRALAREFISRRAEAALYVIATASMLVLLIGSSAVAFIEPPADGSNIQTGGDAFWWAFVTITTVGYGDRFPVTEGGRFVGMLTMAVGIGIFGVLTSYLSSIFLSAPTTDDAATATGPDDHLSEATTVAQSAPSDVAAELRALREEVAELRRSLGSGSGTLPT